MRAGRPGRSEGPKDQGTELEEELEGNREEAEISGRDNYGRHLESEAGRNGECRGGPGRARSEGNFRETPDRERCTRI